MKLKDMKKGSAFLCAALATLPTAVLAQEGEASNGDVVEEITVLGGREAPASAIAVELAEFGNSVQIVEAAVIEAAGYINFAEIAQGLIRGANVGYSPDEGEYTIRLDGGGDRDTLVTLDNVPLYDRGPGVEQIWGATLIPSRMIDRVEIFRGGQSLYFGSNGGLGVVNVVTKRPDGSVKGDAGLMYGSRNTREIWGNYSFPISEDGRHSVMVYGDRYASDGHRLFARDAFSDGMATAGGISDYSSSRDNIGFKYLWAIDDSSELLVNLQYTQIDFQDTFPGNTIFGPTTSQMPLINISYENKWSDRIRTEAFLSYRKPLLKHNKFSPEMCTLAEGCQDPRGGSAVVPQGEWMGTLRPLSFRGVGDESIEGGFEELVATVNNTIQISEYLETMVGVQSINYRDASDDIVNIDDKISSTNAIIVDSRWTVPGSATKISIAGRVDFSNAFGSESVWKASFRQPFAGGFYIRGNGGTSFSLPRTNELFATTENFVGNPDLEPEKTKAFNYGIGYEGLLGERGVAAEIGGFRADISNRIRGTVGLQPNTRFNDPDVTKIRGLTADLNLDLMPGLTASFSFTKQDATPAGSSEQINATPKWFATANLRWASGDERFHVGLFGRYQGPERIAANPAWGIPDNDYGEYFVLNGSLGYWAGEGRRHRVQLRLENILDKTYGSRGAFGDQRFGSAFLRGEISTSDPEYRYPYVFLGKPRSASLSYSYRF